MKAIPSPPILKGIMGGPEPVEKPYQCATCGTRLSVRYQECPECGGFTIDRTDWIETEENE